MKSLLLFYFLFLNFLLFSQLLQGPYVVPLTLMQDDTVEPWGPRPYIRNTYQPMLVIKLLEYGSILTFPVRNHKAFK